jgi:DNA-directed RNA polymerase specialized sigma24 family protein
MSTQKMNVMGDTYLMAQEYAVARQVREEAIYRRYAPDVFAYLLRHVPTYQDAEDLLLEVFLIVLEKLPLLATMVRKRAPQRPQQRPH